MYRVLVVEDDPIIAIDIALNLESFGYHVVGPCHSATSALELLASEKIDIALLDITLEGELTGVDLAHEINKSYGLPFIYLTSYSDKNTIHSAANTRPSTYLVKPFKENDLVPAIEMSLTKRQLETRWPSRSLINKNLLSPITQTEYEVAILICEGFSNKEIAEQRFNSLHTIKSHLKKVYTKLSIKSRLELLRYMTDKK